MWEVWWYSGPFEGSIAQMVESFESRLFAQSKGVVIYQRHGGTVVLAHVENQGSEYEYTTYWLLKDSSANNGVGRYKQLGMARVPEPTKGNRRRSSTVITDNFDAEAIEL
jgi:hypothetical protein